jgi:Holliday junction resolvase-like predicted endonuclease
LIQVVGESILKCIQKDVLSGKALEERTAQWLRSQFKYNVKEGAHVNGLGVKYPWEVDIVARTTAGFLQRDLVLWVECKSRQVSERKVTRKVVKDIIGTARNVRDNPQETAPDILMVVTDTGFNSDAVNLANKHNIYLVEAGDNGFSFTGKMKRKDLHNRQKSVY